MIPTRMIPSRTIPTRTIHIRPQNPYDPYTIPTRVRSLYDPNPYDPNPRGAIPSDPMAGLKTVVGWIPWLAGASRG